MNYPDGFPPRLRPRLDKAILNLRKKYPLSGDAFTRINESIAAYVEIACSGIEKGDFDVGLAHAGLEDFALEMCEDHADMMAQPWWSDKAWEDFVEWIRLKIIYSDEWEGYLSKLDALSEKQFSKTERNTNKDEDNDVGIRGERDPTVAARRTELRNMLRSGKRPTAISVCKRWDSQGIKVPESWTEEGIETWQQAFQKQTHRSRTKKLISKDSKAVQSSG